jgi:hypothetical protein
MMIMKTRWIPEHQAIDGAIEAMARTITTTRVTTTPGVLRESPGTGRVQRMRREKGRGSQYRKRGGWGREMVKGKEFLNKPQEEIISLVPWISSCRRKPLWQTQTQRAN